MILKFLFSSLFQVVPGYSVAHTKLKILIVRYFNELKKFSFIYFSIYFDLDSLKLCHITNHRSILMCFHPFGEENDVHQLIQQVDSMESPKVEYFEGGGRITNNLKDANGYLKTNFSEDKYIRFPPKLANRKKQSVNTQPPNSQPANTQPANTQPANTQPANSQPANTQPANTQPANTQPSNTQPANTQPANPQPANTQPANSQPANTQPANTQPANTQPANTQSANSQPPNTQPPNTQPANSQPANSQPANSQPANTQPANSQPANSQPANSQPANSQPANTQPANSQLANAQPANTQPANTQSANSQPPNTQPPNTQPANSQPANSQPANSQPANTQPANSQLANAQPANTQPPNTQPLNTEMDQLITRFETNFIKNSSRPTNNHRKILIPISQKSNENLLNRHGFRFDGNDNLFVFDGALNLIIIISFAETDFLHDLKVLHENTKAFVKACADIFSFDAEKGEAVAVVGLLHCESLDKENPLDALGICNDKDIYCGINKISKQESQEDFDQWYMEVWTILLDPHSSFLMK